MAQPTITRQYTGQTSETPNGPIRWFFEFNHHPDEQFRIGYSDQYSDAGSLLPGVSDWYDHPDAIAVLNMGGGAAADQLFFGCVAAPYDGIPSLSIFTIDELPS